MVVAGWFIALQGVICHFLTNWNLELVLGLALVPVRSQFNLQLLTGLLERQRAEAVLGHNFIHIIIGGWWDPHSSALPDPLFHLLVVKYQYTYCYAGKQTHLSLLYILFVWVLNNHFFKHCSVWGSSLRVFQDYHANQHACLKVYACDFQLNEICGVGRTHQ